MHQGLDTTSIKLISLNIEGDNHLTRITPFFRQEKPEVICLQEVYGVDVPFLEKELQMQAVFVPMHQVNKDLPEQRLVAKGEQGLTIFSSLALRDISISYYVGSKEVLPEAGEDPNAGNRILLTAIVTKDEKKFQIGTTHFTWSLHGETTTLQQTHMDKLLSVLAGKGEIVFCGDFNAPRGREIWARLAEVYQDTIPSSFTTSLDPVLHRIKNLPYLVDSIFCSPTYIASDIRVISGVSDHQAIVGKIQKASFT